MKSIAYIPGSDGAANASLMTITAVRSSGATTIQTNTVANVPTKFYASMGTPHTFTDPVTGETITVVSEATAVDFAGHVDGSNIEIDEIAPGYTDNGSAVGDIIIIRPVTEWANNIHNVLNESHNDDGTLKDSAIVYDPTASDHVAEGGVWSTLSGLNATMTALVAYQDGHRGTIDAVASRGFTASKDTYVDVLRTSVGNTHTFSLVYTEVANGAASPAIAADSFRLAKIATSATAINGLRQTGVDDSFKPIRMLSPVDLLSTMFSNQITTITNTGTAGGTISYLNLAGLKLAWGTTGAAERSGVGSVIKSVTFPSGFFSERPVVTAAGLQTADERNIMGTYGLSASTYTFKVYNYSGGVGGMGAVYWIAIGV